MKKTLILCLASLIVILGSSPAYTQNVAINEDGSLPNANAILDVKSFNKGMLIPRVSTTGRLAIPNTRGLLVYDTTTNSFWYNTGIAWQNMAAASSGAGWLLNGNSGTDASSFLGTIDNKPLVIKMNNQRAGLIDSSTTNTFWGYNSGFATTTGQSNTGTGFYALQQNTTGNVNVAMGSYALFFNTTGSSNTAIGSGTLSLNGTGGANTALGYSAMWRNTSGIFNTAVGAIAMEGNTTGIQNTAVGYHSMQSSVLGQNNTALGAFADVFGATLNNATVIGASAFVTSSNKVRIGNTAVTVIEGQVPFTTPSDGRFKFQVQEDVKGLDFIMQLRPVTYQFNTKQFDEQMNSSRLKDTAYARTMQSMQAAYTEASNIRRSGFIAQEVEKAAVVSGYNFSGLIKPKTAQEYYSLSYESFVVPLVKAVQEQQQTIADLQRQVSELKQLIKQSK